MCLVIFGIGNVIGNYLAKKVTHLNCKALVNKPYNQNDKKSNDYNTYLMSDKFYNNIFLAIYEYTSSYLDNIIKNHSGKFDEKYFKHNK